MKERDFQGKLIKRLKDTFPGCFVLKNDPSYIQGIPDLILLHQDRWAALEVKRDSKSSFQPNQEYYVDELDKMSFAAVISPDNVEEIFNGLQQALQSDGTARLPKRK